MVVWIAGALYNARRGPRVRERSRRDYFWLVTIAAVWLLYGHAAGIDWGSLSVDSPWIRVPGIALLVSATAFTLWARVELGTMWSSSVVTKIGHALRTRGPYAITRHPMNWSFMLWALVHGSISAPMRNSRANAASRRSHAKLSFQSLLRFAMDSSPSCKVERRV